MTVKRCPASAWNRVRHRVEYAPDHRGESIALLYKPAVGSVSDASATAAVKNTAVVPAELYVPVSPEGAAIRDQVRQPLMYRKPVGYQREFLEAYQPGITFYLPESLRRQLHEMGRTSADER